MLRDEESKKKKQQKTRFHQLIVSLASSASMAVAVGSILSRGEWLPIR